MTRLYELCERLVAEMRGWQVGYAILFASFATFANLFDGGQVLWIAEVYLGLSVLSLLILLPSLRRALFRTWDPLRSRILLRRPLARMITRCYLYGLTPLAFMGCLELTADAASAALRFNQSNVTSHVTWVDYAVSVVAGLEEMWRWSCVIAVIALFRAVLRRWWDTPSVRMSALVTALLLSALAFGSGHILEFTQERLQAWYMFSSLGLILALMAILTGRILLIMVVHSVYDAWVTWLSTQNETVSAAFITASFVAFLSWLGVALVRRQFGFRAPGAVRVPVELTVVSTRHLLAFERERELISRVFHRRVYCSIRHIGTTAIEGAMANDAIDVLVLLRRPVLHREEWQALEQCGYQFCGNAGVKGRLLWVREAEDSWPAVHLQIAKSGNRYSRAAIAWTRRLQAQPDALRHWESHKERWVHQYHRVQLDQYMEGKRTVYALWKRMNRSQRWR
ncbi:GrpB family protein [Alicyclobacillus acidocaldarius]|uniref:GrpB family protein n=1 Tax=Alicyclobacillus acidocaldarius TaxID=405212 RepID=UPI0003017C52|nr:GrpB family protein [Alicyclobacillus acidocaldarius]